MRMSLFLGLMVIVFLMASACAFANPSPGSWATSKPRVSAGARNGWRTSLEASLQPLFQPDPHAQTALARRAGHAFSRSLSRATIVSPAASGQISGKVTAFATSAVIAGIEVCAYEKEKPSFEACAITNVSGEYTISGLQPSEYIVVFFPPPNSGLNYIAQYYNEKEAFLEAEPVSVTAGARRTGIDARLRVGGEITGKVISAATEHPLGEIEVCAFEEALESVVCATTNASGEYAILGLATGSYEVEFSVPFEGHQNYATQYYDGKASATEATEVMVVAESTKAGIDAALAAGGQITGVVTSISTGTPIEGIEVCAFGVASARCSTTDAHGDYDLTSLSTAAYIVGFYSPTGEYTTQWYSDAASPAGATRLSIEEGTVTESIDAALRLAPPQEIAPPTISGSAVEGQTLKVNHGVWTGNPSSYRDEWGHCNAAGQLNSCATIAEGETLTLTAADVGGTIRVREQASNSAGTSRFAVSEPTAVIVAAPPVSQPAAQSSSGSPPPPLSAAPASNSEVLATTTSAASAAQLRGMLAGVLVPKGRDARIGALLAHGGYAASFGAIGTGKLTVSWYVVPKGAHLAGARPVLLARGDLMLSALGTAKITVRLTGRGRAFLKHAKAVKVTAQGSIANSGSSVSATKSFVLRR